MPRLLAFGLVAVMVLFPGASLARQDQPSPEDKDIEELRKALKDDDVAVRLKAARSLAQLGVKAAPAAADLVKLVNDKNALLRNAALQALRGIGAEAIPALVEGLKAEDILVRRTLLAYIVPHAGKKQAEAAVAGVAPLLTDADRSLRTMAAQFLARAGDDGVKALLAVLKEKEVAPRFDALSALAFAKPSPELLAAAKTSLKDPEITIRQQALLVVVRHGTDAVPVLVAALEDKELAIRLAAIQNLGTLRQNAKDAVPALRKLLADNNSSIRVNALLVLGYIGLDAETPAAVTTLLEDPDLMVRSIALNALIGAGKNGLDHLEKGLASKNADTRQMIVARLATLGADSVPLLRLALKDPVAAIRASAVDGLATLGDRAKDAAKELTALLKDDDKQVRIAVAGALWRIEEKTGPELTILLDGLEDGDSLIHDRAGRTLATIGRLAAPELVKLLTDKDATRRRQGALGLTAVGVMDGDVVAVLIKALEDEREPVRRQAMAALAKIPNPDPLLKALKSEDDRVRIGAAAALAQLQSVRPLLAPVPTMIDALKDKNVLVRVHVAHALLRYPQQQTAAHEVLFDAAKDENAAVRRQAVASLALSPYTRAVLPKTVAKRQEVLNEALKDQDPGVRLQAADGLIPVGYPFGTSGSVSDDVVKVLGEGLARGEAGDRRLALMALVRLDKASSTIVDTLAATMHDKDAQMRQYAAYLLGTLGSAAKPAVTALKDGLSDRVLVVRQLSAQALAAIGPDSREAVPALVKALEDGDILLRLSAVEALGRIGPASKPGVAGLLKIIKNPPAATPPLGFPPRFGQPSPATPRTIAPASAATLAMEALARIGPGASEAIPEFARLLEGDADQRRTAASVLSSFGPDAAPILLKGLKSMDATTRALCVEALGRQTAPSEDVVKALVAALADQTPAVSDQAAFALGQLGETARAGLPALLTLLKNRESTESWLLAAQAIGDMGPAAKDAVPTLREALKHEQPRARTAAARALGNIGPEAKTAAAALTELKSDEDVHVRRAAVRALAQINREP